MLLYALIAFLTYCTVKPLLLGGLVPTTVHILESHANYTLVID